MEAVAKKDLPLDVEQKHAYVSDPCVLMLA